MSLKNKVDGNELDLSLNELTDVPVKELAAALKATHLDLSNNLIQTLPSDFASLTHLVKIDLSRNKLTELPYNFGNLLNLQSLDLDKNELKTVPISFCRLKNLRWLDLKDNPLEPKLKSVAGDCLDEKQCQLCAKKVVNYMQSIESNLEREKQKKLKEAREKEALEKAVMEKELEEQRRLKKIEKERRKAESKARNEERLKQSKQSIERDSSHSETESKEELSTEEKSGINWGKWFLFLLCFSLIGSTAYIFTANDNFLLKHLGRADFHFFATFCGSRIVEVVTSMWKFIIPYATNVKFLVLKNIHASMIYISNLATDIELLLSVYF